MKAPLRVLWHIPRYLPAGNCGSEWMAHEVNKWLIKKGHIVRVMTDRNPNQCYEIDGVQVLSRPDNWHDHYLWADKILTHLDYSVNVVQDIKIVKRPVVWFSHNTFQFTSVRSNKNIGVVYNSETNAKLCQYVNPGIVLPPPVDAEYYNVPRGTKVTLVNLNDNKGANVLYKIAELMPDVEFLGVVGSYGSQIIKSLPNVEIMPNQRDIREAYRKTSILIMPSKYESWGRTATEAMASGIPVICSDTFGLRENCGDAAIYCNRDKVDKWVSAIREVKANYKEYSDRALKRSAELNPEQSLINFENFLCTII